MRDGERGIVAIIVVASILVAGGLAGVAVAQSLNRKAEVSATISASQATQIAALDTKVTALEQQLEQVVSNNVGVVNLLTQVSNGAVANRRMLEFMDTTFRNYYGKRKWTRMLNDALPPTPAKPKE